MITFYFTLKKSPNQYIKITAESELIARDVFMILHPAGFLKITQEEPKDSKLYEQVKQRLTN